ncbi:unnamed protein product [Ectocarpus sp. 4 AP-2014]
MPTRVRTTICMSLGSHALLLLSLLLGSASASAAADGAAPTTPPAATADSAFVPPATTVRSWFGSVPNTRPSAATESAVSARPAPPAAAYSPAFKLGTASTWVPATRAASSAISARRSGMTMEAAAGSLPAPKIIIAGAPASGKGTQCSMIKERYGVVHLSTGDMLRAAVKNQTPVGMEAKGYMDEGKLVPDEVIIGIVKDRLNEDDCKTQGWLLDGFPRTRAQADALAAEGIQANSFLLLNVPDEMLIRRVVGRRLDPDTGDIYHVDFNPPPAEIVDRLIQRADDTAEKAQVRLVQYHNNIAAIRECYEDITCSLDGSVGKEEVFLGITSELDSTLAAAAAIRGGGERGRVVEEATEPIEGMKPGTSGLRKKVAVWREGCYLNNFVQGVLDTFPQEELEGSTIIVSGDGRFYNPPAIQTIIRMAAANGVGRVWVGKGGLMSTPAVSAVLREREGGAAYAGLVLTARWENEI